MNQTWEIGKKPSFRTYFDPFGLNFGPQIVFMDFISTTCYALSQAMIVCNIKENQTWENCKKPSSRTDFGPFGPNLCPKSIFPWILPLVHARHCCKLSLYQFQRKLMNQTWEIGEKPSFETDFGHLGPNLDWNFFFINFTSTMLDIVANYHYIQFQMSSYIRKFQTWWL